MDYTNWMRSFISHDTPLRNICFPATHDAGTINFGDTAVAGDIPEWVVRALNLADPITRAVSDTIPGKLGDYVNTAVRGSLHGWIIDGIRLASSAQAKTITEQLNQGIRCLDLRIAQDELGTFRIWHGLLGNPVANILDECDQFLQQHPGEVLYITMGGWNPSDSFNRHAFYELVRSKITYCSVDRTSDNDYSLLDKTYGDITNKGTRARCILVMDDDHPGTNLFWPKTFSPPKYENDGSAYLYGSYTNTESVNYMLQDQQAKLFQAQRLGAPYALYLTLTETSDGAVGVVVNHVVERVLSTIKDAPGDLLEPFIGTILGFGWSDIKDFGNDVVDGAVDAGRTVAEHVESVGRIVIGSMESATKAAVDGIEQGVDYISRMPSELADKVGKPVQQAIWRACGIMNPSYTSLLDLSSRVFSDFSRIISRFDVSQTTFIYVDFFERTTAVEWAIKKVHR